jgi:flavin reductase (DIM6/NTAB) family NADH-FMN oxidoreductase RutF
MSAPTPMRRVMGRFVTGVSVVTTEIDGIPHGMTANSLTSVSLEPAMLLVCLGSAARTTTALLESGQFVVNILSARQEWIALRFAQPGIDHFDGLTLTRMHSDSPPVVPEALARLHCRVDGTTVAGDHHIVVGAVERLEDREGEPLGFYGGRFCRLQPSPDEQVHWF